MSVAIFPTDSEVKTLIPKTFLTGGLTTKTVDLSGFSFSAVRLVAALRTSSVVSASATMAFYMYNAAGISYTAKYLKLGQYTAPVVAYVGFNGNGTTIAAAAGTDAPANSLAVITIDVFNCENIDAKPFRWEMYNPFVANVADTLEWGLGQIDAGIALNGFRFDMGGSTINPISWYKVMRLEKAA